MSQSQPCASRSRLLSLLSVSIVTALLALPSNAQARPAYKSAFENLYPKVKEASKVTCAACHPGKSKKNRNHYGEALAKELKKKNVKDKKTIIEALKNIEDGHCPDPPKTKWKTLLEKGELPCEHNAVNRRFPLTHSLIQRLLDQR
jgi:hypothetical protein